MTKPALLPPRTLISISEAQHALGGIDKDKVHEFINNGIPPNSRACQRRCADAVAAVPGRILIRLPTLIQKTGLSRSTIYHLQSLGQLPRSIRLGARAVAWDLTEIDAWLAAQIERSRIGAKDST